MCSHCPVPCDRVICGLTLWLTFTLCLHYELFKNFRDNSNSVAGQWQQSIWRDCPGQSGTSEGYEREWKMDSIIHTLITYYVIPYRHTHNIVTHTLSSYCRSQDWLKWAKDHLIFTLTLVTQLTVTALRFPVLPGQGLRLASRDHLM